MKQQFNKWYWTILILTVVSIFIPVGFSLITAIVIGLKYKTFKNAFNDLENIQDVNATVTKLESTIKNLEKNFSMLH